MGHSERITLDAHSLIWYIHEDSKSFLSQIALNAIREAENCGIIYIPTIALLEVLRLLEKERYPLSFDNLLESIYENESYEVVPLSMDIVNIARSWPKLELHDRVIFATAIMTNSVLVSKDRELGATGLNVIWSKRD